MAFNTEKKTCISILAKEKHINLKYEKRQNGTKNQNHTHKLE